MRKYLNLSALCVGAAAGLLAACNGAQSPRTAQTPLNSRVVSTRLKDVYAGHFLIGTAGDLPGNFTAAEQALIKDNFNVVTPENCMKPQNIHPAENRWNWGPPDAMVAYCTDNHIQIIGHCLVWHNQTGNWFFQAPAGEQMTKDLLLARMKNHIETEVGRYKGKIKGWDVVNEAIDDTGRPGENLRTSNWQRIIGNDFLLYAFQYAHEADPGAELYYNDYNIEVGSKHDSSIALLKRLKAAGAPITGVGIQGHWVLNDVPCDALDKAIDEYKSMGLKVMITELDITASGFGGGQLGNFGAPAGGASADVPQRQAEAYKRLFQVLDKHRDTVSRVTFWGLNDQRSWRRGQNPLIFDAQNRPKPAYQSIMDVVLNPTPYVPLAAAPVAPPALLASPAVVMADPSVPSVIRIKAGQTSPYTDSSGNVWSADAGYQSGQTIARAANLQVENTKDPAMFRNERYGMSGYAFKVPNGKYTVKLYFAETYNGVTGPGGRVFSFKVKDQEFNDFDVWVKAGGFGRVYVETVPVDVKDGKIDISFTRKVENPEINAIEIIPG